MILPVALLAFALGRPQALVSGVAASAQTYSVDRVLALSIVEHESKFNPRARHQNAGSIDRGLWQMNSRWHPGETDGAAFLALCLFRARGDLARAAAYYHCWRLDARGAWYARTVMMIYQRLKGDDAMKANPCRLCGHFPSVNESGKDWWIYCYNHLATHALECREHTQEAAVEIWNRLNPAPATHQTIFAFIRAKLRR